MVGTFEVLKSISNKLITHPECLKWQSAGKTTDLNAWLRNVHFEHFTSMDCEGKYENMFLFDGFLIQVIACASYERSLLAAKSRALIKENEDLKKLVANAKPDADAESASDDSASDVGGRDEGEKQNVNKKLPEGKHRFTVVVAAAKFAYPDAFKECLNQKVKCQNRKKKAAKLKKRYVKVQEELETEEDEKRKGMLKRQMAYVATKVKETEAEASSLFKSGCEMAYNLNTKVKEKVKSQDQQIKADIASTNAIHKTVRKLNDQVEAQKKARLEWDSNLTFEESLASVGDA